MKLKKFFKWAIKAAAACVIALAVMSGVCLLYYNVPVHYDNETGATDYKWEKSKFYSRGTEGFALGRTDSDGFNNAEEIGGRNVDILFTGSSHVEGYNVSQKKNCVTRLNQMFDGEMFTYNIATSSHNLPYICKNLDDALSFYKPQKYVIIECQSVEPRKEQMLSAVDGTLMHLKSSSGGIVGMMQKIPYFRLIYLQLSNIQAKNNENEEASAEMTVPDKEYADAMNAMLEKIKSTADRHNVTPLIVYHPHFSVDSEGKITMLHNEKTVELFTNLCAEQGIKFASLESDFVNAYKNEHRIPYGFSNTQIGTGHMNAYGHELLAKRIFAEIEDMEAAK